MSSENLKKFAAALEADSALQARANAIEASSVEEQAAKLAALSVEAGTPVTVEELLVPEASSELSLEELSLVTGGTQERVKLILPRHLIKLSPMKHPPSYYASGGANGPSGE